MSDESKTERQADQDFIDRNREEHMKAARDSQAHETDQ